MTHTTNPGTRREELVRQRLAGRSAGRRGQIPPADRSRPLPLAFGQQQMWFLNRWEPDSAEYLVPLALTLRGPLDVVALDGAWQAVLHRHEILRTRYELVDAEPMQVIDSPRPVALPVVDLSGLSDGERAERVDQIVAQQSTTGFDLERAWPVRAQLLRLGPADHVLVVVFHHIACDAWSMNVFAQDLSEFYRGLTRPGVPAPAPLPVQYADYAAWQRAEVAGPALERHLDHWRAQLAGVAILDLPTDRPRPPVRDWHGSSVRFQLSDGLAAGLRSLADKADVTLFVALLAAFQALLSRYTGSNDVPVGTVVSGRGRAELRQMIGYGINSLVMRGQWTGDPRFTDLLAAAKATVLDAFDHQETPFAQLVNELHPERDLSRTPLYQVAFTIHEDPAGLPGLSDVEIIPVESPSRVSKVDLTLHVQTGIGGSLRGQLEYATALFDEATAARMVGGLIRLLEHATADPAVHLSELDILDRSELPLLLASGATACPVDRRVHELFAAQAARTPEAVAVVFEGESLTYADLDARANRLAHHLRARGAGPETVVGVYLNRGPDLIPTLLGVLKSGAAYLPLDPAQPVDRLRFMLADAAAALVVTRAGQSGLLDGFSGEVILLDETDLGAEPSTDPEAEGHPDNLIYVIYTSGSTGRPKAVCLTHANVARLFAVAQPFYTFGPDDVWPLLHSYAFDVSVWEMWGALLNGGRLVVVPRGVIRAPDDLLDLLVAQQVTILNQTPTAFRGLVDLAAAGDPRIDRLALRAVVFAGEKLDYCDLRPWTDRLGLDAPALLNMYGITETTVHSTLHRVRAADLEPGAPNQVGQSLSDLRIHLLDPHGQLVPVGVIGEIHVGGAGVARGYLNRPELTAQRFVPDPFGPPGQRLYRSGDLARRLPDGTLEFRGRIDDQVKIRGYRIELGEIEAAMAELPGIRDAVVVVREDTPGEQRLVGYGVLGDGPAPSPAEIRAALARTLPEYMVPSAFVALSAIPLTANGKLDKRALPSPDRSALAARDFVAPRDAVEEALAAIWADVLHVDRVGVEDSFFDLGGDSIRAVALVGALREARYDVAVRDVFELRTVAQLAQFVAGRDETTGATPVAAPFALIGDADRVKLPAAVVDAYPLSQVQAGMLVEMLTNDTEHNYHNVTSFRIRDERPFSIDVLRAAAAEVVARHEVLRTGFDLVSYSQPLQIVHGTAQMPVGYQDLTGADDDAVRAALSEHSRRERATLFDLGTPTLLRVFAHVVAGAWWLTVTECHAVLEGWSHHSLLMELLDIYRAIRDGDTHQPYVPPAVRYADFIAAELAALESTEDRQYWRKIVAGHPRFVLPTGLGAGPQAPREIYVHAVPFHDLQPGLRALATQAQVSIKSVLVAAHLKVLSQLTDAPEFSSGLVCDARPELTGAERVYGMYLNTVPFAHDRTAGTWRELVRQVFAREVELWPYRRFPLPAIQREAGGERLIEVYFNYQDFNQVDEEIVDYRASIDDSPTEFPLTVSSREGLFLLSGDTRALSRLHTGRIGAMYRAVVEAMVADIDGDARAVYLPAGERERLVAGWRPPVRVAPVRCVHEVFAAQAALTPDAVAVVFGDVVLSYAAVNGWANRLAHYLVGLGVGPECLVGVCLDRGVDLVPALLGVLKSGGGYLPVEPGLPDDRVAFILADAGARVVVTSSAYADRLAGVFDGVLVVVDRDWEQLGAGSDADPVVGVRPEHVMYVMYTSGSTGQPKGVCITHANVMRLLMVGDQHYHFRADDVWPLFHSYAFDVSVWELWGSLLYGGRLVVVPRDVQRSPDDFLDLLVAHRVTVLNQTPSAFRGLVGLARDGDPRIDRLALRAIVFAGEKLEMGELAPWVARRGLDAPELFNMYGITETTVHTTFHRVVEDDLVDGGNPVGHPLADLTVHLLDQGGQLVPIGVPGEIYVGGPGVARGYLNRPGLTAQRFVPDPFGAVGERLYRSGDVARRLVDGSLEFLGRIDDQVKVRGFRVELGEIAAVLGAHPGVRDAVVVVAREDVPGDRRLVAYCVPALDATPESAPTAVQLAAHCAVRLPAYMVPAAFVSLARLPLTNNGKLDKRALPSPERDSLLAQRVYVAARTPVEARLAEVWRDVLAVPLVGVEDSFFDLGGDSIRAVSLVGALRAAGFDVAVRDVFAYQSVAELAELVTGRPAPQAPLAPVAPYELISAVDRAAMPDGVVDAYPLSQGQLGMLIEMLTTEGQRAYHNVNSFLIPDDEPVDLPALTEAARVVAARHDVLRTSMELTGYSMPMQLVHAAAHIPVTGYDLRGLDPQAQQRALRDAFASERATLFDLSTAPLLRISVHVLTEQSWRMTFTQSHTITEGWSYHSFLMELLDAYRVIRAGAVAAAVEAPPIRYADFVAAELESLADESDRAYWRDIVAGHPRLRLPDRWSDGPAATREPIRGGVFLGPYESGLRALATGARASMKAVLLAAHLKVMSQLTEDEAFTVGLVCDARPEVAGAERVYGMHLNTLPFAHDRSAATWRDLVRQVFAREVELWPHRRFPLPAIQRETGGERLIDVIFTYLDFHVVDGERVDQNSTISDSPTEFGLSVTALGGYLGLSSNTEVFNRTNMNRLSSMYEAVLAAMASDMDGDARTSLLPDGERSRLLEAAWAPGRPAAAAQTRALHEHFEEQVAATPHAVAVVADGLALTYADLNARANRLAHHLRELGVGPDRLIGVCLDRGAELIVSLLAVLKAGGAYLPLDPAYPAERRDFMLTDAGAPWLITQTEHTDLLPADHSYVLVLVNAHASAIATRPAVDPAPVATVDNLIYVIYTSGSTGRPKGVCLSHANVHRLFTVSQEQFRFGPADVWSLFFSYAFDFSVWELWGPLLYGGTLVVVPAAVARSPEDFLDLLVRERVTILSQTPSAFRALVAAAGEGDPRIDRLALRAIVFGGERLDLAEIAPWAARLGLDRPELINMYGITETTVHVTYHRLDAVDMANTGVSPVGAPLADLCVHLLDRDGNLVPFGIPGEIHVGGAGLARGYLNRPELTAERFVPDPFGAPGARLYRSGDIARRELDGSLMSLGRIDDQVKIRGYRVELGEIAAALTARVGIHSAVVIMREQSLIGYVVPSGETAPSPVLLRAALAQTLPDYMVPATIVAIPQIPLTPTGKLDKRALPVPGLAALGSQAAYVAPVTGTQRRLAEVWALVLGLDRVGIHDAFFDLGGDSLRAITLVGAIRAAGYEVGVRDLFVHQSVDALARFIDDRGGVESAAGAFAPVAPFELIGAADRDRLPAGVVDAYPASQAQIGMAVEIQNADGRPLYHIASSFRIRDDQPLDADALRAAAMTLVSRHETLRTSVDLVNYSVPTQIVHAEATAEVHVHAGMAGHLAYVEAQRTTPFDLERSPLLRVGAHTDGDDSWWLTLSVSHLITGGWDFNSLLMDLIDVYRQHRDGQPVLAREVPQVRFADFIAAELESLQSTADQEYWRGLASFTPYVLPAGWGDPDSPPESYLVRVGYHDLDPALRALASSAGVSVKAVLHAAHLKVMSQLTDEERFHTGLICDSRPEVAGAELVHGMYINTLPFAHERGAGTWRDLVRQVFAREVELWPHRRFPLPAVQRVMGTGGHPVQVIFDFMDYQQVDSSTVDVEASVGEGSTEFGLVVGTVGGFVTLTTNTGLISRDNAERLLAMYRAVLTAMAADPHGDARAVYLPDGERGRLLAAAGTGELPESVRCVHEVFAAQAALTPDAVAVVFGDVVLSYAAVNGWANRLAHYLVGLGVGPECLVGVCLDRGVDLVPALLGVLKSGGGYLPVEPGLPDDRVAFMLADADARVVVTSSAYADRLAGVFDGVLVVVDRDWEQLGAGSDADPVVGVRPEHVMYVMYTSGSTGQPKGVCATHRNVAKFMTAVHRRYGFRSDDVWPLVHSFAFDVSVWESLGALLYGGALIVVPEAVQRSPEDFLDLLVVHRVTVLNQTPSAFRGLVGLARDGDPRIDRLALRMVMIAGEKLEMGELAPWVARRGLDAPELFNMYGITETTVEDMTHRIRPEDLARRANPIGYPFDGGRIHLLDQGGQLVPIGVPGEIYVGGPGVARGYLNRPGLTAQRFVPDPFGAVGERLYRSGDVARRLVDGSLEFLGRIDDQVKVRGFRVELGEIAAVLGAHPGVRDAVVVVVREDVPGDRRLVAYCVPALDATPESAPTAVQLAAHCAVRLPAYMVPAAFVMLDAFPLAGTGKLDKRALPAPERDALGAGRYVAPRNPAEARVAAVWQDVLGVSRVGVEDNFFDLGGDSIRAVSLVGALRAAGLGTTVRDVFALRTVAGLAASLPGTVPVSAPTLVAPFTLLSDVDRAALPDGLIDAYPAAQTQLGMLVELLASDNGAAYHSVISHGIRDGRPFSPAAFEAAVRTVVDRHEALRTSFELTGFSVPMQLVHVTADPVVRVVDGRAVPAAEQAAALEKYLAQERATAFELRAAPLMRVAAHVASDETWWLTFTLCHAITEGWSIALLREEVLDVYRRLRDDIPIEPAPAPAVRYADFVAGELESLASTQDKAYWQGIVERYPRFRVPAGWGEAEPRQPVRVVVDFPELAAPLRALASATRVSLKAVLHAAHLKVLSQLTEEETFHAGLVCDVRPEVTGADRLHGMFLNTLPFAHDRSARTWRELIGQVYDREIELWPHRRYPLPAIQRGDRQRLIEVLFNYQNFGGAAVTQRAGEGTSDGATVEVTMGEGSTEFALSVIAGDGHLDLLTHSDALTRSNVDRLAQMYRVVLAAMVADPDGDAQAPCLPAGERERLLGGRDDTPAVPVTRRMHELFQEQVARTPDAVAVSWEGIGLTYRELNARANRLAHHLRARCAGPERLVGVCLEPGPDLVPTLLGVLKSGAAYVPLDPAQPAERLRYMLDDAGVRLVVTASSRRPLLDGYTGQIIVLDDADLSGLPESDPRTDGAPDNLIYVIYTSGSTGQPKGVGLTHANVARLFTAAQEHYAFDETDVWILLHSYAFDVSVWELWGALLHGGRLVVVPRSVIRSPEDLLDVLVAERVSVLNQTPSAFRGLLHLAAAGDPRIDRLAVRAVVFAGEKLELGELAPWAARLGLARVALVNMYGITETTVHSTYLRVAREHLRPGSGNAIGRPLSDLRVYLLDRRGQLVPVGVVGEIHVGGAGVARGYVNRAELTAARFVPDPFGPLGARLYRSGDLARRLPDGSLEFCGRLDDQVKIRGHRVELGEIEAALSAVSGVRQAVVVLREDSAGQRQLVAYVVPDGQAPAPSQLREAISRGLPEYMVPAAFVAMTQIPLTPNGKLDKRALPSPDDDANARQEYVAPTTPTGRLLARLWGQILGVKQVGAKDRFLELGGDSIGILRLKADAQAEGLVLPLSLLYQDLTLAEVAATLAPNTGPGVPAARADLPTIPSALPTMAANHVPGAVIALLDRGEVIDLRAYGRLAQQDPSPVEVEAAFQVGSVSKLVSALGALRLVEQGRLALDADINEHLTTWRVPGGVVVTLRHLLGHLSGLTPVPASVSRPDQAVPSLLDLLLGRPPFETPPIAAEFTPGTVFRNADVHYAVLQQLMEDRCGTPFAALMRELVLDPLGMTGSGYEYTIGGASGRPVALGHTATGDPVPGGWTVRPDVAAAGLWATAADLARVVQEIRAAHLGQGSTLLSPQLARQMLTGHPGTLYGLGSIVDDSGPDLEFGHGGETAGYRATVFCRLRSGQGVVVLTNGAAGRAVATFLATALGEGDTT